MKTLSVIVLNYRGADLTLGCLESLEGELAGRPDRGVIVVDNASGDGSAERLEAEIDRRGWDAWARLVRSPVNGGFAAGNNVGIRVEPAKHYVLLNSDARARPGLLDGLLAAAAAHPCAGLVGPRLEDEDGTPQASCFRFRSPLTEFVETAPIGPADRWPGRWLSRREVALPVAAEPGETPWVSFACVLIRHSVIEQVGPLDEGYFMYFEDLDYARRAWLAGWRTWHDPGPRAVHLRGGTSSVKAAMRDGRRVPRYYYESRSRYFARFYGGRAGLLCANVLWMSGRGLGRLRQWIGPGGRGRVRVAVARHLGELADAVPSAVAAGRRIMTGRPDFMVIGAMKCATSTLHEQLARLPDVFMTTPKEPCYFSDDDVHARGPAWYAGLFADASPGVLRGESSTHYTKLPTHPDTVPRILAELGTDLRLVYVMRHPVERLVSHYMHAWSQGEITVPLERAVDEHAELIAYGRYAMQLRPWLAAFGPGHVLPVFFEALAARPDDQFARIGRFLGASEAWQWDETLGPANVSAQRERPSRLRGHLRRAVPGARRAVRAMLPPSWHEHLRERLWQMPARPELAPATRARVARIFDADLADLGAWLGRPITCATFAEAAADPDPAWVDPPREAAA